MRFAALLALLTAFAWPAAAQTTTGSLQGGGPGAGGGSGNNQLLLARTNIKHVVVFVLENHTFDWLYGNYPNVQTNANASSGTAYLQFATMPPGAAVGRPVTDFTTTGVIPAGTTILALNPGGCTAPCLQLSNNLTANLNSGTDFISLVDGLPSGGACVASGVTFSAAGSGGHPYQALSNGNGNFTASASSGVMTVSAVSSSPASQVLANGALSGTNVPTGTTVTSQLTGPGGGAGTYQLGGAGASATWASTTVTQAAACSYHDTSSTEQQGEHDQTAYAKDLDYQFDAGTGALMDGFLNQQWQTSNFCPNPGQATQCLAADVMGYRTASDLPNFWAYANQFVIGEHFFAGMSNYSYPSHLWTVSDWYATCAGGLPTACVPVSLTGTGGGNNAGQDVTNNGWGYLPMLLDASSVSWKWYLGQGALPDCSNAAGVQTCDNLTTNWLATSPAGFVPAIWDVMPNFVNYASSAGISFNTAAITCPSATGDIAFTTNPANTTTIIVNGVTWTFVTSGASGTQTNIQGSLSSTLTQLASDLNASGNSSINVASYSGASTQLNVTYKTCGSGGNAFTLGAGTAGSGVSGSTLTGGGSTAIAIASGNSQISGGLGYAEGMLITDADGFIPANTTLVGSCTGIGNCTMSAAATGADAADKVTFGPIITTGTTNGTTTIAITSATGIYPGTVIAAADIPANTRVVSISGSSVVMSASATGSHTLEAVTIGADPNYQISPTGTLTSGSQYITALSSVSGIQIGDSVDARGLAQNTTNVGPYFVVAINPGGCTAPCVQLQGNSGLSATGVTITFNHKVQNVDAFLTDIANCTLPSVSWFMPTRPVSQHEPNSIPLGEAYFTAMVNAIASASTGCDSGVPYKTDTVVIFYHDDWGGLYDHVVPPFNGIANLPGLKDLKANLGWGMRVPFLLISAYAKPGFIDSQWMSQGQINKFIEDLFTSSSRLDPTKDGVADNRPIVDESLPTVTLPYTVTGVLSNGSPNVTGMPGTLGVYVGDMISGPCIAAGTKVTAVTSTTLTLSQSATCSFPAVSVTNAVWSAGNVTYTVGTNLTGVIGTSSNVQIYGTTITQGTTKAGYNGPQVVGSVLSTTVTCPEGSSSPGTFSGNGTMGPGLTITRVVGDILNDFNFSQSLNAIPIYTPQ